MSKGHWRSRYVTVVGATLIALGNAGITCGGEPDPEPSFGSDTGAAVRVYVSTATGRQYRELGIEELALTLAMNCRGDQEAALCAGIAAQQSNATVPTGTDACVVSACLTEVTLCVNHALLEVSRATTPYRFQLGPEYAYIARPIPSPAESWEIPVQSAAIRALLAERGLREAAFTEDLTSHALAGPRIGSGGVCSLSELEGPASGRTQSLGEYFAASMIEAVDLGRESADLAVELTNGVADARFSDEQQAARASRTAWVDDSGSRSRSAHVAVGGRYGLDGMPPLVAENGMGAVQRPTGGAAKALDYLRLAAPPPDVIAGSQSATDLLTGWGSPNADSYPSLRARLALLLDIPSLSTGSPEQIYARLGITERDLLTAREYMRYELAAFARSPGQTLPPQTLPNGFVSEDIGLVLFAATASRPVPGLNGYYAAAARYLSPLATTDLIPTDPDGDSTVLSASVPRPAVTDLSRFLDRSSADVHALLHAATTGSYLTAVSRSILAQGMIDLERARIERVRLVWNDTTLLIRYYTHREVPVGQSEPEVRLVRGRSGLACAVTGAVDGAPCTLDQHLVGGAAGARQSSALEQTGFPFSRDITILDPALTLSEYTTARRPDEGEAVLLFLVSLRPAAVSAPGGYELIGGFPVSLVPPDNAYRYVVEYPLVPEADELAGTALSPSSAYPAFPAESCAGIPTDQKLALEDELTDDGDGVESSWRRYLDLARRAADDADRLGEQLIDAGLQLDVRAEQALDELADECGAVSNLDGLAADDVFSTPCSRDAQCDASRGYMCADGTCARQSGATIGSPCASTADCGTGYVCRSGEMGVCVRDPLAVAMANAGSSADAARLSECLSDTSKIELVTLGSRPVCAWTSLTSNALCDGATAELPCPVDVPQSGTCTGLPAPSNTRWLPPAQALAFFPSTTPQPPTNPPSLPGRGADDPTPVCEALRDLRGPGLSEADRAALLSRVTSGFFNPTTGLAVRAEQLGWEAFPLDASQVRRDRSAWFGTGTAAGLSPNWPCETLMGAGPPLSCPADRTYTDPSDPGSIFCARDMCANRPVRARFNDRLARAVIAARILTGTGLNGVRVPFYPRLSDRDILAGSGAKFSAVGERQVTRGDGVAVFEAAGGSLALHTAPLKLEDLPRGHAYRVVNTTEPMAGTSCGNDIPADAEWTACPFDQSTCYEVFNDGATHIAESCDFGCDYPRNGADCDDMITGDKWAWDYNLPMFTVELEDRTSSPIDGSASAEAVAQVFSGMFPNSPGLSVSPLSGLVLQALNSGPSSANTIVLGPLLPLGRGTAMPLIEQNGNEITSRSVIPVLQLTRYFDRFGCGEGNSPITSRRCQNFGIQTECGLRTPAPGSSSQATCLGRYGCGGDFTGCMPLAKAEQAGLSFVATMDGNRAFIAPHGFTTTTVLDALELLCVASSPAGRVLDTSNEATLGEPPPISTIADLSLAADYLDRAAALIDQDGSETLFRNFPARAVDVLRRAGPNGAFGPTGGKYAAQLQALRGGLIELADTRRVTRDALRDAASAIRQIRSQIDTLSKRDEILDLQLAKTVSGEVTRCAVAAFSAFKPDFSNISGSGAAIFASTCVDSAVQIGLSSRIRALEGETLAAEREATIAGFERQFSEALKTLGGIRNAVRQHRESIDGALAGIESTQATANRALSRALILDSDSTGRQYNANTVMRRRLNTLQVRYDRARRDAVRLAFLAKLAIEQRLGVRLDTLDQPMPLMDEPPARWHMDVCRSSGIDYARIRSARMAGDAGTAVLSDGGAPNVPTPENYADAYVGDYVRKLELLVEAYRLRFPFQAGSDTSVLSLRDDVLGVRRRCETPVPNLLRFSGTFDSLGSAAANRPGWSAEGCNESADVTIPCAVARSLASLEDANDLILPESQADYGRVGGYALEFGRVASASQTMDASRLTPSTRYAQRLALGPGVYRLSWYAPADAPTERVRASSVPEFDSGADGGGGFVSPSPLSMAPVGYMPGASAGSWRRYVTFFRVPTQQSVEIGVFPDLTEGTPAPQTVRIGAMMLENVTAVFRSFPQTEEGVYARNANPGPYFDTNDAPTRNLETCEDTDGDVFRTKMSYQCTFLCDTGFASTCDPTTSRRQCYWELGFSVSQAAIEQGSLIRAGGFAYGNFNYRIDSLAVNVVGSYTRDCERARAQGWTSSSCYAQGSLPYSIVHSPPYVVRNHQGQDTTVNLFTGKIERARALAAERYITNPISSADRSLIEPYTRREFRGRPLTGNYVVRIWDDPAISFDSIEDIQIVLNYRYWTRFN